LILERLKRNLSLNGFKNVRLINAAAWNKFEDLPLFHSKPDNLGETTVVSELATKIIPDGHIKGAPLEALLLPEEVTSAGLVKIDVEGAEYQVVEGMLNLFPRFPKDVRFLMELKPNVLSKPVAEQLVGIFTDQGFRVYTVHNHYRPEFYQDWFAGRIAEPIGALSGISEQVDLILTREKLAANSFNYRVSAA
jgi:FkbM family methyltransferase